MHDWLTCDIMLMWTYYVVDKLKVIIMGNSYGVLGYAVLITFLFDPLSTLNANSHVQVDEPLRYSLEHQLADRDTGPGLQASFSSSHEKTTYFQSTWNS
jgi:hypothetical protein